MIFRITDSADCLRQWGCRPSAAITAAVQPAFGNETKPRWTCCISRCHFGMPMGLVTITTPGQSVSPAKRTDLSCCLCFAQLVTSLILCSFLFLLSWPLSLPDGVLKSIAARPASTGQAVGALVRGQQRRAPFSQVWWQIRAPEGALDCRSPSAFVSWWLVKFLLELARAEGDAKSLLVRHSSGEVESSCPSSRMKACCVVFAPWSWLLCNTPRPPALPEKRGQLCLFPGSWMEHWIAEPWWWRG